MKRSVFAIMLAMILLTGYGCNASNIIPSATDPVQTTEPTGQKQEVPTEAPTQAPDTEPATVPEETEPVTEPTTPTEPTSPTKPTTPTEPTSPTKPTSPTEPTQPSENVNPGTPTVPSEDKDHTTPKPSEENDEYDIGFMEVDGKTYYFNADGSAYTGWLTLKGDRYYFLEDGSMAVGKVNLPDYGTRYFTSKGIECILVNPWNYVPDDYSVKLSKYGDYKVSSICLDDLKDMIADCKSDGKKAVVVSAYRSHSYQEGLYERRIQRFVDQGYDYDTAVIEAGKRVAVPGTSEHELGLAVDIVDVNYQTLDKKQENTEAQKWLLENSWKYGFILRYPNEKSEVTGIIYEPWHYRYVGKELAKELHDSGLCLEEYFESLT